MPSDGRPSNTSMQEASRLAPVNGPGLDSAEQVLFGKPLTVVYALLSDDPRLARLVELVESQHTDPDLRLSSASRHCGAEKNHLNNLLRSRTGLTLHQLILRRRLLQALRLMARTQLNLLEIALECGFGSMSSFERSFRRRLAESPSAYRHQALGKPCLEKE